MNTKLKCLLLDDELPGLSYLRMLCEQIPELEVVKAFNNPEVFLREMRDLDFDLCIMDIQMPGLNGLLLANLLDDKMVIFTTAYKEFAADAFEIDAVDYILKPIKKERLQQAVQKAIKRTGKSDPPSREFVQLNTDKGKTLLYFDQLIYIKTAETDSRDKTAYLQNGLVLTLKNISFEKLLGILPQGQFCRVNKKEVIALKAVQVFSFDEIATNIQMKPGKNLTLTLSDVYRKEFIERVKI